MKLININCNFVPTTLRKPTKSGYYICVMYNGRITTLEYSARHNAFNADDQHDEAPYLIEDKHILAWTPLKPVQDKFRPVEANNA